VATSSLSRFASSTPLTRADALAAGLRSLPRPSRLEEPLGLEGQAAAGAAALGIETKGDLLEHLPHSHRDRRDVRGLRTLATEEEGTVEVTVRSVAVRPMRDRRRKRVEARVADESGPAVAVWFNQPWIARQLGDGARVRLHGRLKRRNQFWVTEHEVVGEGGGSIHTSGLVPVYPATEKLSPGRLRELAWELRPLIGDSAEPLPAVLRVRERLPDRAAALVATHFPEGIGEQEAGRRRLAFEELLELEVALAARRRARREAARAPVLEPDGELVDAWLGRLPFEPTDDQGAAFEEIDRDLASDRPMQRLLMGEVGTGKTVVALHAMLRAVESGRQAALMAPTETLAEQHLTTLDGLLGGATPIELLTGSTPAARRRATLERLASGELRLVVGTHALIEPTVEVRDLALCVIDEQHRFGVRQRAALDAKAAPGWAPHMLHMTATPIPRTLELTAYGDLDVTTLRELPAGRRPVETHVVSGARARARAYERAREEIARGRRCFVVCPLVEESEALQARAATEEADRLSRTEFRAQRVRLIHGQMPSREKAAAMRAFAVGEADVLVATSVIEVGIDVPEATVMIIEAAERYGLSQLHQLRGRIGRGGDPAVCIAFGDPSLPRLAAIASESDGFRLAEVDLGLRGAGEILGTRQHGQPGLRVARLPDDAALLERAKEVADAVTARDPALHQPEHVLLRDAALARFGPELEPIAA
jgi:ATP-dependent DNA helicase RecG